MSQTSSLSVRPIATTRTRRLVLAAAILAVGVHLWGLYRVSGPPSPTWLPYPDKIEHCVGFALPVALILFARRVSGAVVRTGTIAVVAAIFAVHAVVSELIQHFFYRHRTGDPRDSLADLVGVSVGIVVFLVVDRRRRAPERP